MDDTPTIDTIYADIVALRAELDDLSARSTIYQYDKRIAFDNGQFSRLQRRARKLHADAYQLSPLGQRAAQVFG